MMINEKQNFRQIARRELTASTKNETSRNFDSTDVDINQLNQEIRIIEEINVFSENLKTLDIAKKLLLKISIVYKK